MDSLPRRWRGVSGRPRGSGRDVFGYTSWATGAAAYREVTAEILKRIGK